jgi:flagellar motor switch protein FliM
MSEVLSQNQIDDLLSSLKSGDIAYSELESGSAEKKVRPYDFKIPKKFNKEQLKTLSIIYENYGRVLSSFLSGTLRNYCEVEVATIEEQRYFEYSNALPENILMGVLEMLPLQGTSMITMSQPIAFAIVDRLLGGQGEIYEVDRDYTDIEVTLLQKVIRDMSFLLKDAWSNVFEINPNFLRLESNSRQSQLVSPNETVVIIVLKVKIKDVEGDVSFCMPYEILEPVLEHLNTRYWFTARRSSDEERVNNKKSLVNNVNSIPLELKVILGKSHVSLKEIMDLQAGDVIPLDKPVTGKAVVMSNKEEWFRGTLGTLRNHVAVRIDQVLLEGGAINGRQSEQ